MSTPEQPAGTTGGGPTGGGGGGGYDRPPMGYTVGTRGDLARMPIPGNAEFLVWLVILIMLAIISLASDALDSHGFAWDATILTGAYLLSRGIAKASRVLEQ
jgi:hypothetical protein